MALLSQAIAEGMIGARPAASAGTAGRLYWATDTGVLYRDNGVSWDVVASAEAAIEVTIDGGGAEITDGVKLDVEVPFTFLIDTMTIVADQAGSIVVDIWQDTYANYPPTDADSITAAAPPTLAAAIKARDAVLTDWILTLDKGSTLRINVDSCTTITRVTISLRGLRT